MASIFLNEGEKEPQPHDTRHQSRKECNKLVTGNAEGVRVDLGAVVADLVLKDPVVAGAGVNLAGGPGSVSGLAGHAVRALDAVPTTTGDLL